MLGLDLWVLILLILISYVLCIIAAVIKTQVVYKREFARFLEGRDVEDKHKVELHCQTNEMPVAEKKQVLLSLESNLKGQRFLWRKKGSDYCCFHGLFIRKRIKCLITYLDGGEESFRLRFSFYDRFLSPVMIPMVKRSYQRKIRQILVSLTKGLPVDIKHCL